MEEIKALVERHLRGGYEYEIFIQRLKKLRIETSEESLENLSTSEEWGIGIRVLREGRMGFAYTTSEDEESIRDVVRKAAEMCDLQSPDRGNLFVTELKKPQAESVFDREGVDFGLDEKVEFTLSIERRAKELDSRIKGVRKTGFTEGVFGVEVFNSHGVHFAYEGTLYTATIAALAQEGGDSAISWEYRGARRFRDLQAEEIARDVVFKSTSLLNPAAFSTRRIPVVFFRESFAMLLEAFSDIFLGDSLVKGKTLLREKVGEKVGWEGFSLVDDGALEGGFATTPYDAEGIPHRRNVLVERGVFRGFLHSLYTATLTGAEPTGNSGRSSFRNLPLSSTTNLYVEAGDTALADLLSAEEELLLVIDLMGLHTVDPVSGEFSLGASGVLYRRGEPQHAVRGVTVAGNVLDLWNKIVAVGKDFKFYGSVGSPSVLVREVAVGGN